MREGTPFPHYVPLTVYLGEAKQTCRRQFHGCGNSKEIFTHVLPCPGLRKGRGADQNRSFGMNKKAVGIFDCDRTKKNEPLNPLQTG